jgi:hypothetical protein
MGFTLAQLTARAAVYGIDVPPDIDARGYLWAMHDAVRGSKPELK